MFSDEVELRGFSSDNVSMTLASEYNAGQGFVSLERTGADGPAGENLLTAPIDQGIVATEAFSIWFCGWNEHIDWLYCSPLED